MGFHAVSWALKQKLPPIPKFVLVVLCEHAHNNTGQCWPGIDEVADETSLSPRSVVTYIAALVRNGYVSKQVMRGTDGKRRNNHYWITFDRLPGEWIEPSKREDNSISEDATEAPDEQYANGAHGPESGDNVLHGAHGPGAPACTLHIDAEPSGLEPSTTEQVEGPAPPLPVAPPIEPPAQADKPRAVFEGSKPHGFDPKARQREQQALQAAEEARRKGQRIFVFEGSAAWHAWLATRSRGYPVTTSVVDGKTRRGWWFPSLFPPPAKGIGDRTKPQNAQDSPEETEYFPDLEKMG